MFTLDANIDADVRLSDTEVQYLRHVEEGKIAPLTLKEKIRFTNDLLHGHNIKLEDDVLTYGYEVKMPKKKAGVSGRPKGEGRGSYTKANVEGGDSFNNVHIDNMSKSWAALFGK